MKRLLLMIIVFWGVLVQMSAENTLFYDSKQLTCDLITSICQDKDGFIWIGTDYGLNKFNGMQFTHYYNDPKDSASLADNSIKALMLDNEGILWVGGVGGLQYYVPEENVFRTVAFEGSSFLHIKCIVQLRSGEIWAGSSGRGLFRIRANEGRGTQITEIPGISEHAHCGLIYEDKHGILWISIDGVGLLRYNPSLQIGKLINNKVLDGGSAISGMAEDRSGNLLIATSTTAYYYDRKNESFIKIEHEESWLPMRSLLVSKRGKRYAATLGKGLKVIQPDLKKLSSEVITLPQVDINNAKIRALYEDRSQNLWIGCYHKGLVMVSKESTPFHFWGIPNREYPGAGVITALHKDNDGQIVSGIEYEGVFKITPEGNIVEHLFAGTTISSIYKDYSGNLWFGGFYSGLYMQDSGGKVHLKLPEIRSKDIKKITGDDKGNLYISLFGHGFIRYHVSSQTITEYKSNNGGLRNDWVNTLLIDSKKRLWIGHHNGVDYLDPIVGKFVSVLNLNQELGTFITYALLEDMHGNIWIGTNKGLMCYHPETIELGYYNEENGLSNNFVYGLAKDKRGNIWCSTLKGINQIKVAEGKIASFYSERGLVDNEYTTGASYQSSDGVVSFGGVKGITTFHPDSVVVSKEQVIVVLSNLYLGGEAVTAKSQSGGRHVLDTLITCVDKILLAYEDNTFTFEFSTLDYRNPGNIFYEYRIREYEKKWNSTQLGVNQITYNHLNPGKYTFEVRACTNGEYTRIKVIRMEIASPWWRSSFAYVCYTLVLLVVAYLIYLAVRRQHQKEINEEKIKFFINLSHEIRSPLTLIISPLESLLKRSYDADTMTMLRLMQKNVGRIINLLNQLLDMRKIEKGQLHIHCAEIDMVKYIKELISLFTYQAQKRSINLYFDYEQEELPAWIDPDNFDKVLVNLLSNAFKYTPDGGEIKICLREKVNGLTAGDLQHSIHIEVVDSGFGIDANKLEKIFERFYQVSSNGSNGSIGFGIGLNLCRMIVGLHHGTIHACNRQDRQGSRFIIHIPYGKKHLRKFELVDTESKVKLRNPAILEYSHESEEKTAKTKYHKTNYKIVVVDDDDEIRNFLEAELSLQHKVYVSHNGKEGLQTILKQHPDIIISDVMMPEMDGISLLKTIRNNPNVSHIPFILLTSKAEYKDRIDGLSKGADVYLGKPFIVEELKVHIKNLIETRLLLKGKFSGARDQEGKIEIAENKSGDERLMERVMNVMNKFLDDPEFNVEVLAREVGLSRVQLHRKMKEIAGVSTAVFIRNLRMKKAATLLQEGKLNISEIADAVGFDNQANFSTVFKKFYAMSPTEYAASVRNKDE
ncbi:two-component regulator propeller domain-containing protein [uncultured Bacteroides sp.]|jgi:ligand-binding sensor domain-containing protein/DNA-binding response OmpR family regulator/nitrogen-specific signal transduction histidine kinase|uniref:hybrid sensor histidine kinase/response regulator transcription factor n=1 Tax=uncultured Bacteroides sp. TaxID=162156 RepID=UPI002583F40F|nr:two-component regulator propeller domain-containing protein [uncultured Bacteroides sp.]